MPPVGFVGGGSAGAAVREPLPATGLGYKTTGHKLDKVIVVADDLGASADRNHGILQAMQAGTVTTASLMINGPAVQEAIALFTAAGLLDARRIGLHLNLTEGRPISSPDAVSSLLLPAGQVQPGTALGPAAQLFPLFLGKHAFHRRCLDGTIGPDQIANETKAQLDLFEQLCGFRPITADGHQHCHVSPRAVQPIAAVFAEYAVLATRIPTEPGSDRSLCQVCAAVSAHAAAARVIYARAGVAAADAFVGLSFCGRSYSAAELETAIRAQFRPPGIRSVEVMTHPRTAGSAPELDDFGRSADRERELEVLARPALRESLSRWGELVPRIDVVPHQTE